MKKKRILFLAGDYDQAKFITHLQQLGHYIILVDYLPNPPAKKVANEFYQISTLDLDKVLSLAETKHIDLITTAYTDQALLTAAYVAEKMNLPFYLSYEQAVNVTNKFYMKEIFQNAGIPTAKNKTLSELDKISHITDLNYPLVVKPCDCNSSKGILKVYDKTELYSATAEALKLSRSHKVIIEEYAIGRELSIDIWLSSTTPILLGVSSTKKIKNSANFTIVQSEYPVSLNDELLSKIKASAEKIAVAFNLKNMPMIIQLIENEGDIKILEFSARIGGGSKYRLINYISGVNVEDLYTKLIFEGSAFLLPKQPVTFSGKYLEMDYLYAMPGIFSSLQGVEELKIAGIIEEYFPYKTYGAVIKGNTVSSDRIGGFLISADSKEDLLNKRHRALSGIKVFDENKNDILIRNLYE